MAAGETRWAKRVPRVYTARTRKKGRRTPSVRLTKPRERRSGCGIVRAARPVFQLPASFRRSVRKKKRKGKRRGGKDGKEPFFFLRFGSKVN